MRTVRYPILCYCRAALAIHAKHETLGEYAARTVHGHTPHTRQRAQAYRLSHFHMNNIGYCVSHECLSFNSHARRPRPPTANGNVVPARPKPFSPFSMRLAFTSPDDAYCSQSVEPYFPIPSTPSVRPPVHPSPPDTTKRKSTKSKSAHTHSHRQRGTLFGVSRAFHTVLFSFGQRRG